MHPREEEAEAGPEADAGDPHARHVTACMRMLTAIATAMNVPVATMLAGEPTEHPPRPLPDVHPAAVFAPKPISTPATRRMAPATRPPPPERSRVSQLKS